MSGLNKIVEEILEAFYSYDIYTFDKGNNSWSTNFEPEKYRRPIKLQFDLIDKKNNKKILKKGEKLNFVLANKLKEKGLKETTVSVEELIGKYTKEDIKDNNQNLILQSGFNITKEILDKILSSENTNYNLQMSIQF